MCDGSARITRRCGTAIWLIDYADAIAESAQNFRAGVGRAVVYRDDFDLVARLDMPLETLLECAHDRAADRCGGIEDRYYDRHPRHRKRAYCLLHNIDTLW